MESPRISAYFAASSISLSDSPYGARSTPRSVMMAAMYLAGVTSKAGLQMPTPLGVSCLPPWWVTSTAGRSSMGMRVAGGGGQIDGGPGRGDVERDAVLLGQNRHVVGADLVGGVAVGGDAVRAHDHGLDAPGAHEAGGHVVADHGGGDVVGHQFPGGEPRALQKGPRFVGVDVNALALLDGRADDAQRGSVAAGGQRAGVAVGQHAALVGQQRAPNAPMVLQAAMSSSYMACASARIFSWISAKGCAASQQASRKAASCGRWPRRD